MRSKTSVRNFSHSEQWELLRLQHLVELKVHSQNSALPSLELRVLASYHFFMRFRARGRVE